MLAPGEKRASLAGLIIVGAGSVPPPPPAGFTVSAALRLCPLYVPVMVTAVLPVTVFVEMAKVALVAPAATVTFAGTVAAAVLLLVNATTAPAAGAALLNLTVPCEDVPPVTDEGLTLTDEMLAAGGAPAVTVRVAERVVSENAVIVTDVVDATADVVTVKFADVWPAAIDTIGGGLATL